MFAHSRHVPGELLDRGTVVEGELSGGDRDVEEAEGQGDRDRVCGARKQPRHTALNHYASRPPASLKHSTKVNSEVGHSGTRLRPGIPS